MTPDENDLPPCPFCGSAARMVQLTTLPEDDPNWNGCYIECCNATCAASTNIHFGEADKALREKWTRRAGEMPGGWTVELESQIAARHAERERRKAAEALLEAAALFLSDSKSKLARNVEVNIKAHFARYKD